MQSIHCKSCSYPLSPVRGSRCPECGRAFNPADPRTYTTNPCSHPGTWKRFRPLFIGIVLGACLGGLNIIFETTPRVVGPLDSLFFFANAPWVAILIATNVGYYPLPHFLAGGPLVCFSLYGALVAVRPRRHSKTIVILVLALIIGAIHTAAFAFVLHHLRSIGYILAIAT